MTRGFASSREIDAPQKKVGESYAEDTQCRHGFRWFSVSTISGVSLQ